MSRPLEQQLSTIDIVSKLLTDLPSEILETIIEFLLHEKVGFNWTGESSNPGYNLAGSQSVNRNPDIRNLTLTCKILKEAADAVRYRVVAPPSRLFSSLENQNREDAVPMFYTEVLEMTADISKHVRHLNIVFEFPAGDPNTHDETRNFFHASNMATKLVLSQNYPNLFKISIVVDDPMRFLRHRNEIDRMLRNKPDVEVEVTICNTFHSSLPSNMKLLGETSNLVYLKIWYPRQTLMLEDLEFIRGIRTLRKLYLEFEFGVDSFGPVRNFQVLESLQLTHLWLKINRYTNVEKIWIPTTLKWLAVSSERLLQRLRTADFDNLNIEKLCIQSHCEIEEDLLALSTVQDMPFMPMLQEMWADLNCRSNEQVIANTSYLKLIIMRSPRLQRLDLNSIALVHALAICQNLYRLSSLRISLQRGADDMSERMTFDNLQYITRHHPTLHHLNVALLDFTFRDLAWQVVHCWPRAFKTLINELVVPIDSVTRTFFEDRVARFREPRMLQLFKDGDLDMSFLRFEVCTDSNVSGEFRYREVYDLERLGMVLKWEWDDILLRL